MILYTLQANIFALLVLIIIYIGVKKHTDMTVMKDRLFMYILLTNALILIIDCISICLYDVPGQLVFVSQSLLTTIFYMLNPLPGFFWVLYVYVFIFHEHKQLKKLAWVASILVFINALLSISSIWTGSLFIIGSGNSYERGPLFFLMPMFAFIYTVIGFFVIIIERKKINPKDFVPLLLFAVPPAIGGLLQSLVYGLVVLWPSLTISLLIIFVFIQSKTINTDFLTGLNNDRAFYTYLSDWKKWKKDDKSIVGFMMDMDNFKDINDRLGHHVGDRALKEMSKILKNSFRRNDFIARLGGDEFVAIIEVSKPSEINAIEDRLLEAIDAFNQMNSDHYHLSISYGLDTFNPTKESSFKAFFNKLDKLMYEHKSAKK